MTVSAGLSERLVAAYGIEVDSATVEHHLAAVGAALRSAPRSRRRVAPVRSRLGVVFAAIALLALPAVAIAAEDSLPGDLLYPVKQATERIRGVVDDDLAATHRVEELETLIARDAPAGEIAAAVDRALAAVDDLGEPGPLSARLDRVRSRIRAQHDSGQDTSSVPADPASESGGTPDSGPPDGHQDSGPDTGSSGAGQGTVPGTGGTSSGTDSGTGGTSSGTDSGNRDPAPGANGQDTGQAGDGDAGGERRSSSDERP